MKIFICTHTQLKSKQGIHLSQPDEWCLNDALDTAERDGFPAIYIHAECIGTNNYKLNGDVLTRLFELSMAGVDVIAIHAAWNDTGLENSKIFPKCGA